MQVLLSIFLRRKKNENSYIRCTWKKERKRATAPNNEQVGYNTGTFPIGNSSFYLFAGNKLWRIPHTVS